MRQKEHEKDLKQLEGVKYTRARKKESLIEIHQLALTDHVANKNHMIDWEGAINQDGGATPSSRSLLEAVVRQELVLWHICSSDEGSSQSQNISAGKNFLPKRP